MMLRRIVHLLIAGAVLTMFGCIQAPKKNVTKSTVTESSLLISLESGTHTTSESSGNITIDLSMNKAHTQAITINWQVQNVGASPVTSAFSTTSGTVTILPGYRNSSITLALTNDTEFEDNEVVNLVIVSVSSGTISNGTHLITVVDDDTSEKPTLFFSESIQSITEGTVTIISATPTLNILSHKNISIPFIVFGSATLTGTTGGPHPDHDLANGVAVITTGQLNTAIYITIIDDTIIEPNETISIRMIPPTDDVIPTSPIEQHINITDDETGPTINFESATFSATEDVGAITATVTLTATNTEITTVYFSFSGSASSGVDFSSPSLLQIPIGQSTGTFSITVADDTFNEATESATISMSSAVFGTIGASSTFTIELLDNDAVPSISFIAATSSSIEGDTSMTQMVIPVALSAASGQDVSIDFSVSGTATMGLDYTSMTDLTSTSTGQIIIPAGDTLHQISLWITADTTNEADETIIITLDPATTVNTTAGATMIHTGTIVDNDPLPILYFIKPFDYVVERAGTYTLSASLSQVSGRDVSATLAFAASTATGGGVDYNMLSGTTIVFPAGTITATLPITIVTNDAMLEVPEEFIKIIPSVLTNCQTVTSLTLHSSMSLIITDQDPSPIITFTSTSQILTESINSASAVLTLDKIYGEDLIVDIAITGTATGGGTYADYTGLTTQYTLYAGSLTKKISLSIIDDIYYEDTEDIILTIVSINGALVTIGGAPGDVHEIEITDDDFANAPTVSFEAGATTILSENTGTSTLVLSLDDNVLAGKDLDIIVEYQDTSTALASPSLTVNYYDFEWTANTTMTATVTIPAYTSTAGFVITIIDDIANEATEFINLSITEDATNGIFQGTYGNHIVQINDDDPEPLVGFESLTFSATENISVSVTITLTATSGRIVTVPITINSTSTATAIDDHNFIDSVVTIPEGTLTATTTLIFLVDDALDEYDETIITDISTPSYAITKLASASHTLVILDNDVEPVINLTATSQNVTEGTGSNTIIFVTATLSAVSGRDIEVTMTASGDNTVNSSDHDYSFGQWLIPAGTTTATIQITITGDSLDEYDEMLAMTMTATSNVFLGSQIEHIITILDDDAMPDISFEAPVLATYLEGTSYSVTVALSAVSGRDVTATLSLNASSTATTTGVFPDTDFTAGIITIPQGSPTLNVTFQITNDALYELDESMNFVLTNPNFANLIAPSTYSATITNTDTQPNGGFSVPYQILSEANGAATTEFHIDAISGVDVIVNYLVLPTSTATVTGDFTITSGSVTIPIGATGIAIALGLVDDGDIDPGEEINLSMVSMSGGATAGGAYTTTQNIYIDDNESPAAALFSAASSSFSEASSFGVLTFTMNERITTDVTINFVLSPTSTASNLGIDHNLAAGQVLIPAETLTVSTTFTIINDLVDEFDETIVTTISAVGGGTTNIGTTATHTLTIIDDDATPNVLFMGAVSTVNEFDGTVTATVILDAISGREVTVQYTTNIASTATSTGTYPDHDLTATGSLVIPRGDQVGLFTFNIINDTTDEYNETVIMELGAPTYANIGAIPDHTITILDDDAAPAVSFTTSAQSNLENITSISATITMTATSEKTVTVPFSISGASTSTAGTDHSLSNGNSIISVGSQTGIIYITVINDLWDEDDETLILNMGVPSGATTGTTTTHTATILDDDPLPTISFTSTDYSILESSGIGSIAVSLSSPSGKTITVPYTINGGSTAIGGGVDYTFNAGTLTITSGNPNATISPINITEDYLTEYDETIIVNFGVPTNAALGNPANHTLTITDNDQAKMGLGYEHTCIIIDGAVKCWGDNSSGQLGRGNTTNYGETEIAIPPDISLGSSLYAVEITAGAFHTCVLLQTGQVKCWGENGAGQLGLGDTDNRGDDTNEMGDLLPIVSLGTGLKAVSIAAGGYHTCAILNDNTTKCWGSNASGQVGQPTVPAIGYGSGQMGNNLASIPFLDIASIISAGENHTCVIYLGRNSMCFGENSSGQLGQDDTTDYGKTAGDFSGPLDDIELAGSSIRDIVTGNKHVCVLTTADEVKCWGDNTFGQLGNLDTMNRGDGVTFTTTPGIAQTDNIMTFLPALPLPGGKVIEKLVAGDEHSCLLFDDNSMHCWGDNTFGQIGRENNPTTSYTASTPLTALPVITVTASDLFTGGDHLCAITGIRQATCWGRNNKGQLLRGNTTDRGKNGGDMGTVDSVKLDF